jgi:hypothetical protein
VRTLAELRREGQIRHISRSNMTARRGRSARSPPSNQIGETVELFGAVGAQKHDQFVASGSGECVQLVP